METLVKLPNIARLSERVLRVLGLNPSRFTLQGTNTYLIGKGPQKVLLDTGGGIPEYIDLLQKALDEELNGATISKIICTHWHHDHVGGVADVMQFLASRNINLNDPPTTASDQGSAASSVALVDVKANPDASPSSASPSISGLPAVYKFPNSDHDDPEIHFQQIKDQQEIRIDDDTTLVTLHTPGHTSDHCSFYLKEEDTLFTADCVLGQGTAVFEDLSAYINSLEKQLAIGGPAPPTYKIYPGHGPIIEDGPAKIREYIMHRLDREKRILSVLASDTQNNTMAVEDRQQPSVMGKTAMQIVAMVYEGYPESLYPAAEHQVLLHLKKLEQDAKVKKSNAEDISDAVWEILPLAIASL